MVLSAMYPSVSRLLLVDLRLVECLIRHARKKPQHAVLQCFERSLGGGLCYPGALVIKGANRSPSLAASSISLLRHPPLICDLQILPLHCLYTDF